MIHIPAKQIETEDGPAVTPAGEIPAGWSVRYIDGEYQAIPPDRVAGVRRRLLITLGLLLLPIACAINKT